MTRSIVVGWAFALLAAVSFTLWMVFPHTARAQQNASDLRATIQAELLSDPRTTGLTQVQLGAIVDILTKEASKQGITAQDIRWRPQTPESFTAGDGAEGTAETCGTWAFLCVFNEAFGFTGPDATIPFILGAASMGLIWIFAEMLHRRRHGWGSTSASM